MFLHPFLIKSNADEKPRAYVHMPLVRQFVNVRNLTWRLFIVFINMCLLNVVEEFHQTNSSFFAAHNCIEQGVEMNARGLTAR